MLINILLIIFSFLLGISSTLLGIMYMQSRKEEKDDFSSK